MMTWHEALELGGRLAMSHEIPSPRQRVDEWARALPGIWRAIETERAAHYRPDSVLWPSPVYMPLAHVGRATLAAIVAKGDAPPRGPGELSPAAVTSQCLAAWRMTQGIYRIDPMLYEALIATPVSGDIPADVLLYLPEWCVYIETPGMRVPASDGRMLPILGLWYWLDQAPARGMILCIGIDLGRRPPLTAQHVPLVGTIEEAIDATLREWEDAIARGNATHAPPPEYRAAAREFLPPALSLVLYLCSRAAEISGAAGLPGNPAPVATRRHGARLYPAEGPRHWEVGVRLGAALRRAMGSVVVSGAGVDGSRHVAPHVRGAHWHTYLTGPRKDVDPAERQRELRWLPPIPIGIEDYDALLPSVHPVRP